ncbi:MAG TPA: acyltransferase [Bryobacteraceae bacterium]|nr:acyltransferase [Bryobacteraceae bacterium]
MSLNRFILKIRKGETPFYRAIRTLARSIYNHRAPRVPDWLKPPFRVLYELHFFILTVISMLVTMLYKHPLFQARCASVGRNLSLGGLPFVAGHLQIHIGNDVLLGDGLAIFSGRWVEDPRLVIKDRAQIGWNVELVVNREIIIEEDVRVASRCRIADSDGHPREADLRAQNAPVHPQDIRPVRICRYAWIGQGSSIMKGVTIGEGAIVASNSMVVSDVPPYSLAMGNPAEIYFRNYGRPSKPPADGAATA